MKQHYAVSTTTREGWIRTSTLCRRQNRNSDNGTNATNDAMKVTCAFCRKLLNQRYSKGIAS